MKTILGLLVIIAGIALGIYVGLWLCFVGGIIQLVDAIKAAPNVDGMEIAWGVLRIVFAGFAGMISAFVLLIPGMSMLKND